jgi:hypothetical protein
MAFLLSNFFQKKIVEKNTGMSVLLFFSNYSKLLAIARDAQTAEKLNSHAPNPSLDPKPKPLKNLIYYISKFYRILCEIHMKGRMMFFKIWVVLNKMDKPFLIKLNNFLLSKP